MKRLALSVLVLSAAAQGDITLPFIAFHNDNKQGGNNSSAVFSLNGGSAGQLIGSPECPGLSDNVALTVATYIPASLTESGISNSPQSVTWKYRFSGFSGVAFQGMYHSSCHKNIEGSITKPVHVNSSEMVLPFTAGSVADSFVKLTISSSFFNYLLGLTPGASEKVTTSALISRSNGSAPVQNNQLLKLGDYRLDNSAYLEFGIDPITAAVTLKSSITGQRCKTYQHIALKGQLCEVMKYSYKGSSVIPYSGALSLSISKINPLLSSFQSKGLSISLTFDEKAWYNLSNGSIGTPALFADKFLQEPEKSGGQASLKMFFPNEFIQSVALEGEVNNLTDIATLCLNKPRAGIGTDFCFHPGSGVSITPVAPGIEIKPDNPDYTLDPTGFSGSGKGKIGDSHPVTIPYTIYTTSKDPAIAVTARVTGPGKTFNGQDYCMFSGVGAASAVNVPVPGDVLVGLSRLRHSHNCKGIGFNIAPPSTSPGEWLKQVNTTSPDLYVWQTPLVLEFPMNNSVSLKTYDGGYWEGTVSAQGLIEVSASWN